MPLARRAASSLVRWPFSLAPGTNPAQRSKPWIVNSTGRRSYGQGGEAEAHRVRVVLLDLDGRPALPGRRVGAPSPRHQRAGSSRGKIGYAFGI